MASAIRRVRSKVIYRGRIATLTLDSYRDPAGRTFRRETVRHPGSVVILPVLDDGRLVMIRQFRHAVGRVICEIPAGTTEPGEPFLACARRELAEETGYRARRWKRLCEFYPAPGLSTERMVLYLATGLKTLGRGLHLDADERIRVKITPRSEAIRLLRSNRIVDAKSIIGLLWGLNRIRW